MSYSHVALDPRDAHRRATVRDLLDRCCVHDQRPPLGDHALAALLSGEQNALALGVIDRSSRLVGYTQATPTPEHLPTWTVDIAIDPSHRDDHGALLDSTLGAILTDVRARNGSAVQWWRCEATDIDRAIAARHGLLPTRELLEMNRDVRTITDPPVLAIRPFAPGIDNAALLEVNNLAFDDHPDQGSWTLESLTGRLDSGWFDPAGLLLHCDHDGTLIGFCWTKIHRSATSATGEIYVVAVRPSHRGRGLGCALAHAGLVSLRERAIDDVMLFVDSNNAPAQSVYQRLGFAVVSTTTALQQTMTHTSVRSQTDRARSRAARRALRRLPPAGPMVRDRWPG